MTGFEGENVPLLKKETASVRLVKEGNARVDEVAEKHSSGKPPERLELPAPRLVWERRESSVIRQRRMLLTKVRGDESARKGPDAAKTHGRPRPWVIVQPALCHRGEV